MLGALVVVRVAYPAEQVASLHLGAIPFDGKPEIIFGLALVLILLFARSGIARRLHWSVHGYRLAAMPTHPSVPRLMDLSLNRCPKGPSSPVSSENGADRYRRFGCRKAASGNQAIRS